MLQRTPAQPEKLLGQLAAQLPLCVYSEQSTWGVT